MSDLSPNAQAYLRVLNNEHIPMNFGEVEAAVAELMPLGLVKMLGLIVKLTPEGRVASKQFRVPQGEAR